MLKDIARAADKLASYSNTPNDRGGRWIERPDMAGLRFVGFSDDLVGVDHNGWYTSADYDGDGEVMRGCVYQLPSRGGRPLFVEAYQVGSESRSRGFTDTATDTADDHKRPAVIYLAERHLGAAGGYSFDADSDQACRDAARGADREAELSADSEREWREADSAGVRAGEYLAESIECRAKARELVADFRGELRERGGRPLAPAICQLARDAIRREIRNASKAAANYARLVAEWDGNATFAEGLGNA